MESRIQQYIYTHAVIFVAIILFLLDVHVRVLPLVGPWIPESHIQGT